MNILSLGDSGFWGGSIHQQKRNSLVLMGFILLLGIALRFYNLGSESYWVDEMYTVIEGRQSIQQILTSGRLDQPPAYYLPFYFWVRIFGEAEVSTRTFSVLPGLGSLVLIYLIGQRLFASPVGLLGAFLMAISSFQIQYSQEARFYSFFQFATLLSFLFFILVLDGKRKSYSALYIASSILMLYSHTYGVFIIIAQNLIFVVQIKKNKDFLIPWLGLQSIILMFFLPYFYILAFGETGGIGGTVASNSTGTFLPSIADPVRIIFRFIFPPRATQPWSAIFPRFILAGILLLIGVGVSVISLGKDKIIVDISQSLTSLRYGEVRNELYFLICWLICPIILPFGLSFLLAPLLTDRYAICAAPALYLFLAFTIFNFRKVIPIVASLVALMVIIAPGLYYYYTTNRHQQWREAASFVRENSNQQGEVIVFAGGMGTGIEQISFNWYYQGTLPNCSLSNNLAGSAEKTDALMKCISGYSRYWVVIRNSTEPSNPIYTYETFFTGFDQADMRLIRFAQFVDISVYLFEVEN